MIKIKNQCLNFFSLKKFLKNSLGGGMLIYTFALHATQTPDKGTEFSFPENSYFGPKIEETTEDFKRLYPLALQGNAAAQQSLGSMYYEGYGVEKDYVEALGWFMKAAEQENISAQHLLGHMYYHGHGISKDYKQAFINFKKAADKGDLNARQKIGIMYFYGQGIAKDEKQAFTSFKTTAEKGNAEAECYLGGMYAMGQGVAKDDMQAFYW